MLTLGFLYQRRKGGASIASNVMLSVLLGVILGGLLQTAYGLGHAAIAGTLTWVGVVGGIYVRLLQMVVVPLVFVSILGAARSCTMPRRSARSAPAWSACCCSPRPSRPASAWAFTNLFGLRAESLVQGARELERGSYMEGKIGEAAKLDLPTLLQQMVPMNVFADLSGTRSTSVMGVVVFAAMLGFAALALKRDKPEVGERVQVGIDTLNQLAIRN